MKNLLLIFPLTSLAAFGCANYTVPDAPAVSSVVKGLGDRVALIGFYTYKVRTTSFMERQTKVVLSRAWTNYTHPMKGKVGFGKPVTSFPVIKKDTQVPQVRLAAFRNSYLTWTKNTGKKEIGQVIGFQNKKDGEGERLLYLKRRNVDYYVVGILMPPWQKAKGVWSLVTILPFLGSGGIFPWVRQYYIKGIFLVYDKDLNLLHRMEYQDRYYKQIAWWKSASVEKKQLAEMRGQGDGHYPPAYYGMIRRFGNDAGVTLKQRRK